MLDKADKEKQFSKLYTGLYPKIFRLCKGYFSGNETLASDATQEIFTKIWENLDAFRNESKMTTWIYRIAVNVCLLHLRESSLRKKLDVSEYINRYADSTTAQDNEKLQKLYTGIGKLDEIGRSIVIMLLEGVDYTDIAKILGIKEVTLRVRIHRLKKQLTKYISDENF